MVSENKDKVGNKSAFGFDENNFSIAINASLKTFKTSTIWVIKVSARLRFSSIWSFRL